MIMLIEIFLKKKKGDSEEGAPENQLLPKELVELALKIAKVTKKSSILAPIVF